MDRTSEERGGSPKSTLGFEFVTTDVSQAEANNDKKSDVCIPMTAETSHSLEMETEMVDLPLLQEELDIKEELDWEVSQDGRTSDQEYKQKVEDKVDIAELPMISSTLEPTDEDVKYVILVSRSPEMAAGNNDLEPSEGNSSEYPESKLVLTSTLADIYQVPSCKSTLDTASNHQELQKKPLEEPQVKISDLKKSVQHNQKPSTSQIRHLNVNNTQACRPINVPSNNKNHLNIQLEKKKLNCKNCKRQLGNSIALLFHECFTYAEMLHCKICFKVYCDSKSLEKHVQASHLDFVSLARNPHFSPRLNIQKVEDWYAGKIYSPLKNLSQYMCAMCEYITKSKKSLKIHIKSHFKLLTFDCKSCKKKFKTKFSLNVHIKQNHPIQDSNISKRLKSYACKKCHLYFKSEIALHIHLYKHLNNKIHESKHANHAVFNETVERKKQQKSHIKKYTCKVCKKKLNSESEAEKHMFSEHFSNYLDSFDSDSEIEYECKECDFKCSTETNLQNHSVVHTKFKCKFCDKILISKYELEEHTTASHLKEWTKYLSAMNLICTTCGEKFASQLMLFAHVDEKHLSKKRIKRVQCNECQRNFSSKPLLKIHKYKFHTVKEFPCKYCSKSFSDSKNFRCHNNKFHKELWAVDEMSKFGYLSKVARKVRSNLYVAPPWSSESESEEESDESLLVNNTKVPEVVNLDNNKLNNEETVLEITKQSSSFNCDLCNLSFLTYNNFLKHRNIHSKYLLNDRCQCDICSDVFISIEALTCHAHQHSKMFSCTVCNKQFTTKQGANYHVKKYHWEHLSSQLNALQFKKKLDEMVKKEPKININFSNKYDKKGQVKATRQKSKQKETGLQKPSNTSHTSVQNPETLVKMIETANHSNETEFKKDTNELTKEIQTEENTFSGATQLFEITSK